MGTVALRATPGLEYRTRGAGLYGEVQPYTLLSAPILALKARPASTFILGDRMNRRWLFLGLAVLGLGWGQAQSNYFGLGASLSSSSQYGLKYGLAPLLSVQIGGPGPAAPEFGSFELRATFNTLILFSDVGLDALTPVRYPDASLRLYLGGGPDVLVFATMDPPPGSEGLLVFFGAHGTVGLESLSGGVRPFAELQPAAALIYNEPVFGLRLRVGINL